MSVAVIELTDPKPGRDGGMTYKQLQFLRALAGDLSDELQPGARGLLATKSSSWLMTNVSKKTASKIIEALKGGNAVELRYP